MRYDHVSIERKWQERWAADRAHEARDGDARSKWYGLIEFPYPSGEGLHVGHLRSYTAMDVIARKRRMEGKNVLFPIGWDAFGLPAENYAIKMRRNPRETTSENIANFRRQLQAMGFSFDWSREVNTTDPAYYRWTQWIFLQFLKHGLAYKAMVPINWCPSCKIGLANEEAVGGVCERCGGSVEKRDREQWMLKITAYAEKLLAGLETVDYIERVKVQQRNWIGRSEGATIGFRIVCHSERSEESRSPDVRDPSSPRAPQDDTVVEVFTTRPDTLFGATYLVLAPEHPFVEQLLPSLVIPSGERGISHHGSVGLSIENVEEVRAYLVVTRRKTEIERANAEKDKTGVELKGIKAINPANGEEVPVWIADYVLAHHGTGAIMAVPAHDERDFAFAQKYGLLVRQVIRKVGAPIRSYVMGTENITERDLAAIGVVVAEKTEKGYFKVEIPRGYESAFEDLMREKMTPGFWNEYIGDETVFLFKHEDGHVERLVLNAEHVERIDQLACAFNHETYHPNDPGNYINGALARNEWYRPIIVHDELGILMNSGKFDGMASDDAKRAITEYVGGQMTVTYRIRDWVFSRQRYWGEPIPVVFCAGCTTGQGEGKNSFPTSHLEGGRGGVGVPLTTHHSPLITLNGIPHTIVPIPEDQLPVLLPSVEKYQPTDTGDSPLAAISDWVNTKCPRCGGSVKRETDVMPNWAGSSWYFLAYLMRDAQSPVKQHSNILQNVRMSSRTVSMASHRDAFTHWMPVDWYNGGMEHTTLHLLYSRFWNLFLHDIGAVPAAEPYAKRTSHGMILAADGEKMSKSRGNVVNPDDIIAQFGADAVRVYEMFIGPFDQAVPWQTDGLIGCRRFLERVVALSAKVTRDKGQGTSGDGVILRLLHRTIKKATPQRRPEEQGDEGSHTMSNEHLERFLHRTIQKVSQDIEAMRFNTAVSAFMEFTNALGKEKMVPGTIFETFLTLLAPFAPHLCEELWERLQAEHAKLASPEERRDEGSRDHARGSIFTRQWPSYDPAFIAEDEVDLVVQVDGKVRATIRVPADITENEAKVRALAESNVAKHLSEEGPKRVVFVPGRILNLVQ